MSVPVESIKKSLNRMIDSLEETGPRRIVVKAAPEHLKAIFRKLLKDFKDDFYFDFLATVDYVEEGQIEASYNVWIYSLKTVLTVKLRLPRDNPTIATISDMIPSAVYHEQEAYDLMGVTFSGNQSLKRGFLVAEEAQDSFPLRKEEAKKA